MTITEQKLEGEYRYINSRLITNAEEIAFYNGNYREKLTLLASFEKLVSTVWHLIEKFVLPEIYGVPPARMDKFQEPQRVKKSMKIYL